MGLALAKRIHVTLISKRNTLMTINGITLLLAIFISLSKQYVSTAMLIPPNLENESLLYYFGFLLLPKFGQSLYHTIFIVFPFGISLGRNHLF